MDNNEEFSYSYAAHNYDSSDDESGRIRGLSNNINFIGYEYMNGDSDDYDDDDDEDEEESDENDYDTETSEEGSYHGLGKYGYLVDKSSERDQEVNNNENKSAGVSTKNVNGSMASDGDSTEFDGKTMSGTDTQVSIDINIYTGCTLS